VCLFSPRKDEGPPFAHSGGNRTRPSGLTGQGGKGGKRGRCFLPVFRPAHWEGSAGQPLNFQCSWREGGGKGRKRTIPARARWLCGRVACCEGGEGRRRKARPLAFGPVEDEKERKGEEEAVALFPSVRIHPQESQGREA